GKQLTEEYLSYAIRDTQATWEVFQKLRDIYKTYGFSKKLHYIFSEASLGKAMYQEMLITPVLERMKNISPELHGYHMTTYYGGRSEIHVRNVPCEIMYCDFKSEYPTVFSLMNLQDMLLAENYEIVDVTEKVKTILQEFFIEKLQDPSYWQQLRIICKIS